MFKRTKIIYPLLCMLLLLFSCRRDDGIAIPSEDRELKLVLAKPNSITAMNVATPVEGQEFGLYVLPTGSTDLTEALENNRKFRYESGELLPADGGEPIIYPNDGSAIDVILYSPYQLVSDNELKLDIGDQSDQAKLDLVYSKLLNLDRNNPISPINFLHRNSKLKFTLLPGQGLNSGNLSDVEISLVDFQTRGTIDILNGNLISLSTSSTIILGLEREAIILSPLFNTLQQFRFKVGDKVLEYNLPLSESFVSGKQYEYQVTINLGSVEVKRVSAMDWQVDDAETVAYQAPELEFVDIPAGTFTMGSGDTEPGIELSTYPAHEVTLSRDFQISKYEITVAQYLEFLKAVNAHMEYIFFYDPNNLNVRWIYNDNFFIKNNGEWEVSPGKENLPMNYVTWHGARAYAQWAGGDLPTEAQWEYAARAGSKADYFFLEDHETLAGRETELEEYAWYDGNTGLQVKEIGLLKPNPWGLYDIYGNVEEICLDEARIYSINTIVDPGQITGLGSAFRGGSSLFSKDGVNSTFRRSNDLNFFSSHVGFRIIKYPSN